MHIVTIVRNLNGFSWKFYNKTKVWKYSLLNMARRNNGSWFLFVCVNQQNTWICGGGTISTYARS
jgi:hypothetical protein